MVHSRSSGYRYGTEGCTGLSVQCRASKEAALLEKEKAF
ncbi:hypothetical protein ASZ90_005720 [hydrocarbon metagenome]|uniref:Uncharacterized protein n=1 Tax=hydrocarbon metagenome TaxID=938273 RepID=A0A0W8FUN7_9ZZZZ